ncbi:MAG: YncE family protein [Candidatus Dormibacteria bacterium]
MIDRGTTVATSRRRPARRVAMTVLAAATALLTNACGVPTASSSGGDSPTSGSQTAEAPTPTGLAVSATSTAEAVTTTPVSASASATAIVDPASSGTAYIALSNGTLVSLDLATEVLGDPIPIGHTPAALAVTPDGRTAYVADADTGGVTVVDLSTGSVEAQIPLPTAGATLTAIAISPDGSTAYAAVGQTSASTGTVIPIALATGSVGTPLLVGPQPVGIAITPDGQTAYVADNGATEITPIDLANDIVGSPIQLGTWPTAVAVSPTGGEAYALGAGVNDTLTPIKLSTDPAEDQVGSPISAGSGVPQAVALTPDGTSAFVADTDDALQIALPAGTTLWSTGNAAYNAVAISPGGTLAVVTYDSSVMSQSGLTVVDVGTDRSLGSSALDADPVAVAFATSSGTS